MRHSALPILIISFFLVRIQEVTSEIKRSHNLLKKILKFRRKTPVTAAAASNNISNATTTENMGQAVRIAKYDRAENERNAIPALKLSSTLDDTPLRWHRLDDGVMGGQSETVHSCSNDGSLHFTGQINTNGGGFCSIRAPIEGLPKNANAIRLRFRGDGKTYKMLLSDGTKSTFGPSRRSPSWQHDIPSQENDNEEEIVLPLSAFRPSSLGRGGVPSVAPTGQQSLEASSVREIGFMLSLKLSDGSNNPPETFGHGIFPFSFTVISIQPAVIEDDKL